jgi:predicted RNA-binding protein YlxR (DUF448 family)
VFSKKIPQRSCIACRGQENWTDLIRTVLIDNVIRVDEDHRMHGRGAWLHRSCYEIAIERRAFNRAFNYEAQLNTQAVSDYLKGLSN